MFGKRIIMRASSCLANAPSKAVNYLGPHTYAGLYLLHAHSTLSWRNPISVL